MPSDNRFVEWVRGLLIEEHNVEPDEADRLIKTHTNVMVNGMMAGRGFDYRATAMALLMADEQASKHDS